MGACCSGLAGKTEEQEQGASEDTSVPSTYRSPPAPMPYHIALVTRENERSKPAEAVDSDAEEEEDSCPICLEEYEKENPKLITKCEHCFHLACILEWMERSNSCPVCDQELIFDPPVD